MLFSVRSLLGSALYDLGFAVRYCIGTTLAPMIVVIAGGKRRENVRLLYVRHVRQHICRGMPGPPVQTDAPNRGLIEMLRCGDGGVGA